MMDAEIERLRAESNFKFQQHKKAMQGYKPLVNRINDALHDTHKHLGLLEPFELYAQTLDERVKACEALKFMPASPEVTKAFFGEQYKTYEQREAARESLDSALARYDKWVMAVQKRGNENPQYREVARLFWQVYAIWDTYSQWVAVNNEYMRNLITRLMDDKP
jgi:hypothetical protein